MVILDATEVTIQQSDLDNWYRHPEPKHKRSPGVHLSQILKHIALELNMLKDLDPEDFEEQMPMRMVVGVGMERQLAGFMKPPVFKWQPGEVKRDGVIGSPDGISHGVIHGGGSPMWMLEEFKATAKTAWEFDITHIKHRLYLWQIMGYLAMHSKRPLHARLHMFFKFGNYQRPYNEVYQRLILQFERAELEKHWAFILKYKDKITPEVH